MPTKNKIIADMDFNILMKTMVDVLKGIAATQFAILKSMKQDKSNIFERFFNSFFQMVDLACPDHPLARVRSETMGVVVITSELGFMGALNEKICNKALEVAGGSADAEFIVVGQKAAPRIRGLGKKTTIFPALEEKKRVEQSVELKDYIFKQVNELKIGKVVLVYAKPISMTSQNIEAITLIPASELFEKKEALILSKNQKVYIESEIADIMTYLLTTWIMKIFLETFFESKLSEYAAQMMQLEGSAQYLEEEAKKLRLQYNRKRQEEVDTSMREVFSAMLVKKD